MTAAEKLRALANAAPTPPKSAVRLNVVYSDDAETAATKAYSEWLGRYIAALDPRVVEEIAALLEIAESDLRARERRWGSLHADGDRAVLDRYAKLANMLPEI